MMNSSVHSNSVYPPRSKDFPVDNNLDGWLSHKPHQKERAWKGEEKDLDSEIVVPCVTQDEEEEVVIVEETIAAEGSTRNKGAKYYNAEIYLENYERMFQRQDKEHEATLAHVKPLLEILESISSSPSPFVKSIKVSKTSSNEYLVKEFLVDDLKRAIQILLSEKGGCYDFIQTDLQWMMVLNSFTECTLEDETISWAEILFLYKASINGMQTLQHMPSGRIRSRTVAKMLSSLQQLVPPSKSLEPTKPSMMHRSVVEPNKRMSNTNDELRFWKLVVAFLLGITLTSFVATFIIAMTTSASPPVVHTKESDVSLTNKQPQPILVDPQGIMERLQETTPIKQIHVAVNSPYSIPTLVTPTTKTFKEEWIAPKLEQESTFPKEMDNQKGKPIIASTIDEQRTLVFAMLGMSIGGPALVQVAAPFLSSSGALIGSILSTSNFLLGFTVVAGTLIAHGIRDFVKSDFVKSHLNRFRKSRP